MKHNWSPLVTMSDALKAFEAVERLLGEVLSSPNLERRLYAEGREVMNRSRHARFSVGIGLVKNLAWKVAESCLSQRSGKSESAARMVLDWARNNPGKTSSLLDGNGVFTVVYRPTPDPAACAHESIDASTLLCDGCGASRLGIAHFKKHDEDGV